MIQKNNCTKCNEYKIIAVYTKSGVFCTLCSNEGIDILLKDCYEKQSNTQRFSKKETKMSL